jgi:hypothetical protein
VAWLHPLDPAERGVLVVTEGVADGLVAAQAGFPAVGVLGSQYPDRRVVDAITTTMERSPVLTGASVVVCFDADTSGRGGADRLCGLFAARGVPHRQVAPPDGLDLTGWAVADPSGWAAALAAGAPAPTSLPTSPAPRSATAPAPAAPPTPGLAIGLPGPG